MKKSSLHDTKFESVSHNNEILKKVLIRKGEILNITQIAQITFSPGQIADSHSHPDMYEIFYIEEGEGVVEINDRKIEVKQGDCITVEPHEKHEVINSSSKQLKVLVIGIEE